MKGVFPSGARTCTRRDVQGSSFPAPPVSASWGSLPAASASPENSPLHLLSSESYSHSLQWQSQQTHHRILFCIFLRIKTGNQDNRGHFALSLGQFSHIQQERRCCCAGRGSHRVCWYSRAFRRRECRCRKRSSQYWPCGFMCTDPTLCLTSLLQLHSWGYF